MTLLVLLLLAMDRDAHGAGTFPRNTLADGLSASTTSETSSAVAATATAATPGALPRRRRMQANTQVSVPTAPGNPLAQLPRVQLAAGGSASISMEAVDIKVSLDAAKSLSFTAPRYTVSGSGAAANSLLTAPALVLNGVCGGFSLTLTNNLPFQGMDPGATSAANTCEPSQPTAGFKAKKATHAQYYCDPKLSSDQMCDVLGDNVFVNDRPKTPVAPGATLRYSYTLGGAPPGVAWYHPHIHGSVGLQLPTAAGPIIIPESWLPGGINNTLYVPANGNPAFSDLISIMSSQPLESSTILRIDGFWFRKSADGTVDDDSLPFLGLGLADRQNTTASPLLYDVPSGGGTAAPKFSNPAGRDWALVNGAFQPTITMTDKTYARWQVVNTMSMKWLDLTFQQSKPAGAATFTSDLIMASGNRADVLVKCNKPGTYVLASGAGPFHTNYDACRTPHCELFGDVPPAASGLPRSANNLYGGLELAAAVLAVVQVNPRSPGASAQSDLPDNVASSRLDRFAYLNYKSFPAATTSQCFSFMNSAYGGMCAVNNGLLPDVAAVVEEGSHQVWTLRDTTFHPFHLHDTPVRLASLPPCATSVTNNWAVGDWVDVLMLPVCLNGCKWADQGSGGGACNSPVDPCDEVKAMCPTVTSYTCPGAMRRRGLSSGSGGTVSSNSKLRQHSRRHGAARRLQ
ncbi:hypothetical protein HXX76_005401 [Chlamydomonas incerta]|uniref:Plastocyanin-like domain-containing protein n=1 Tax=Chlamydomonas incerta TaxID=51695 RepID=A0A835TI97_CHLIN|nr:hypothetical protein HXX76_005401 [Chlamydomonas incerta]|eukprot:KAG2438861.1 hypothetical protein HXX76_005401 [Chlamydomonas incerta]